MPKKEGYDSDRKVGGKENSDMQALLLQVIEEQQSIINIHQARFQKHS